MQKKILLIYTGGTIGMIKDYATDSLRPFDFENISDQIPELTLINAKLSITSFDKPVDSSDINHFHWKLIAEIIQNNYDRFDGFVILHGTDTMSYSASALSFIIDGLQKPVIFTGSQLPIGDLRTDAKENLISSIHFAALEKNGSPLITEVCIYFEYKLYRANRTTKLNANHFDAFRSPNYPLLGESGVHMTVHENNLWRNSVSALKLNTDFSDNVTLLKIFPGMSDAYLKHVLSFPQTEAIVIEAFGSGNIFHREEFNRLLLDRSEDGVFIIVSTQCLGGSVELGMYSASNVFIEAGALSAKDMTTETALIKSMFLLGNYRKAEFRDRFAASLKGECTSLENNFS